MTKENLLRNVSLFIPDILFALFLAIAFTISPSYIRSGTFSPQLNMIARCLLYFAIFLVLAAAVRSVLKLNTSVKFNCFEKLLNSRHPQLILAALMLLFWLPSLIALYPGTVINDTWNQLAQFIRMFHEGKVYLSVLWDHHPVFATFIMGQVIVPIAKLTGNWNTAVFIYVLVQATLTCLAFSYTLVYMYRTLKTGTGFTAAVFGIYCLLPVFPASVQTVSKDALSAWIFVLFAVQFLEMVRTDGLSLHSSYSRDVFFLVILACCATKKISFYVIFFSLLAGLLAIHRNRRILLIMILLITVLVQLGWPFFMKATGIGPGGKQEMFSIPFQQTARYVKEHPDDITEEEYEVLDKLLTMSTLADRYDPIAADPVKGYSERGVTSDYIKYIKVWFRQGLRHPGTYFQALLAMEAGWVSWTEYAPLMNMDWHIQLDSSVISPAAAERPEPFSKWAENYQKFFDALYRIPVIKYLFTYGFYAALIPAFVISTLLCRSKKEKRGRRTIASALAPAAPMFFSLALGCWLAPVSIHFEGRRYLYPITYTALLMLAWCRYTLRKGDEVGKDETDCGADSVL